MTRKTFRSIFIAAVGSVLTAAAVLFGVQAPAQALSNATWGSGGNIIGMDYQHINYGGAYLQRRSSNPGCTASLSDIDAGGKVPSAWDNQISSFENFGGGVSGWYRCYSKRLGARRVRHQLQWCGHRLVIVDEQHRLRHERSDELHPVLLMEKAIGSEVNDA